MQQYKILSFLNKTLVHNINRDTAIENLLGQKSGTFLLRRTDDSPEGELKFSYVAQESVYHARIQSTQAGYYCKEDSQKKCYPDILTLINTRYKKHIGDNEFTELPFTAKILSVHENIKLKKIGDYYIYKNPNNNEMALHIQVADGKFSKKTTLSINHVENNLFVVSGYKKAGQPDLYRFKSIKEIVQTLSREKQSVSVITADPPKYESQGPHLSRKLPAPRYLHEQSVQIQLLNACGDTDLN